jgi:hypothetical protein
MDCYHCADKTAQLKCENCDSEIFRFCSNECGINAHPEHKALCYNRHDVQQIKTHLFLAIGEMQDQADIDDALEAAVDLIEHQDQEAREEAHEIIQSHLQNQGFERIELFQRKTETEKAEDNARRAAAAEKKALERQEIIDKAERARLTRGDRAMTKAEKRKTRLVRRAERLRKRAARQETRAERALARGERRKSRTEKPGLRERWHAWRKGGDVKRAERYKSRARTNLDNSSSSSSGSSGESDNESSGN